MQKLWTRKQRPSLSASREAVVTVAREQEEDRERGDRQGGDVYFWASPGLIRLGKLLASQGLSSCVI